MLNRRIIAGSIVAACVAVVSTIAVPSWDTPDVQPESFQAWRLPSDPPFPANNVPSAERAVLGKMLFFDPRLSHDGTMSCATCHSPMLGWSDGLSTGRGFRGQQLARATPTVLNAAYNSIQMWDGRAPTLEAQATGPMQAAAEMNMDMGLILGWLNSNAGYRDAFAKAYPGESIDASTVGKAIATFERTLVSKNTPFDRWLAGDKSAMNAQQKRGLQLFIDENKGNCAVCHQAPNFTDNGFHNLGLASFGDSAPDLGRFAQRPVASMRGSFKTPALRDVELTSPYFHDGSANTLMKVVDHYVAGGINKTNLSPMKALTLSPQEKEDLVAFMKALTSPRTAVTLPELPAGDGPRTGATAVVRASH